jgi:3,2-trans-enoyl-CoA isomerase
MINTIGYREAEKSLQIGHLFNHDEALKVKLVDEVVEQEQLLFQAEKRMQEWLKIPSNFILFKKKLVLKIFCF